jgi:hypothetical protein
MIENRNTILAVILSGLVLIAWQYFYNIPHHGKAAGAAGRASAKAGQADAADRSRLDRTRRDAFSQFSRQRPRRSGRPVSRRNAAIAASPRVKIDTPNISGSISLTGARIDDVALVRFRETVDPKSPGHRTVLAIGHQGPVLCRVRFRAVGWLDHQDADQGHRLGAGRRRFTDTDNAGDADLEQRPGPHLQAHDLDRRQFCSRSRTTSPMSAMRRSPSIRSA